MINKNNKLFLSIQFNLKNESDFAALFHHQQSWKVDYYSFHKPHYRSKWNFTKPFLYNQSVHTYIRRRSIPR